MSDNPSFWAVLPASVRYDKSIPSASKILYAEITAMTSATGYCYATNKYFSALYGVTVGTVSLYIRQLAKAGYITVDILRDPATNQVTQRRIYVTGKLPDLTEDPYNEKSLYPSHENSLDPPTKNRKENNTSNNIDPPKAPKGAPRKKDREPKSAPDWRAERFAGFWGFYPRGENKQAAIRAWDKLRPSDELIDVMGKALAKAKRSEDWQKGIGIPYASTWLNQRRWEDERREPPQSSSAEPIGRIWAPDPEVL